MTGSEPEDAGIHPTARLHPTAVVHPTARVGPQVELGPYVVVGPGVVLEPQTVVEAFAVLEGPTRVGARCRIATGAVVGGPPQDVHYQGEPTQLLIEEQVYLGPYTTVSRGTPKGGGVTRIGQGCVLEYGAHVGHDCQLGREVRMEPLSALAGHVVVGDGAEIGALAGVHQFVRIGRLARVEPHSMVGKDVPPFVRVAGNPAGAQGLYRAALAARGMDGRVLRALETAVGWLYGAGLTAEQAAARMEQELGDVPEVQELVAFLRARGRGVTR